MGKKVWGHEARDVGGGGYRSQFGSRFVARGLTAMSNAPQSHHFVGAVLGGLLFEDWLQPDDLFPLRAAGTAGLEACSLAITAYSGLLQEREQRILQLLASASPILVSSDDDDDDAAADVIVVSDDDDIWEQAFGRDADWEAGGLPDGRGTPGRGVAAGTGASSLAR